MDGGFRRGSITNKTPTSIGAGNIHHRCFEKHKTTKTATLSCKA